MGRLRDILDEKIRKNDASKIGRDVNIGVLRKSLWDAYYAAKGLQKQGNKEDKLVAKSLEHKLQAAIKMFEVIDKK